MSRIVVVLCVRVHMCVCAVFVVVGVCACGTRPPSPSPWLPTQRVACVRATLNEIRLHRNTPQPGVMSLVVVVVGVVIALRIVEFSLFACSCWSAAAITMDGLHWHSLNHSYSSRTCTALLLLRSRECDDFSITTRHSLARSLTVVIYDRLVDC